MASWIMMDELERSHVKNCRTLVAKLRWGAIATLQDGFPYASNVAFVFDKDERCFLMLMSQLAQHTQNLHNDNRATLVVSQIDDGKNDPQTLSRASFMGRVMKINRGEANFLRAKEHLLTKLPSLTHLFGFADFNVFALKPKKITFIEGFGKIFKFDGDLL